MIKRVFALFALAMLAACATTAPSTFSGKFDPPPAGSRIVVMTPNVQLAVLSAAGIPEPREDWSVSGRDNLATKIAEHIQAHNHAPSALDPNTAMEGRTGQIIRLHDAVGGSLMMARYGALPTHKTGFEWTLGDGVTELGAAHNADYALFVGANGSYASAGRVAAMIGFAMLGVSIPLGGQQAYASLVDLRTGNILWFNVVVAGPSDDMRTPEGAETLVRALMKDAPL